MDIYLRGCDRVHRKLRQLAFSAGDAHATVAPWSHFTPHFAKHEWIYLATLEYLRFTSHEEFSSRNLRGLVIGSMEPWIEAWLLHLGFKEVVTSEYNQLSYMHPAIITIQGGCKELAQR
jgi:hypothetical protein